MKLRISSIHFPKAFLRSYDDGREQKEPYGISRRTDPRSLGYVLPIHSPVSNNQGVFIRPYISNFLLLLFKRGLPTIPIRRVIDALLIVYRKGRAPSL